MTKSAPMVRHMADAQLQVRAEGMPDGIAGRVSGVALTYEVLDTYGTVFARGCAKRTIDNKVRARKVPLLMDHERRTGAHVGVVSMMQDAGDSLMMTAELFDTPEGRAALEYVKAVIAAGATTGFSVGFVPRRSEVVLVEGQTAERFLEIELREVSLTPIPAVPGTDVLGARQDAVTDAVATRSDVELLEVAAVAALRALPEDVRAAVVSQFAVPVSLKPFASADAATRSDPVSAPALDPTLNQHAVSLDERIRAVRSTFSF